jgi:hypothetical protein
VHFIILMYRCVFFNTAPVCFDKKTPKKKKPLLQPPPAQIFFSYIEHLLKPLQPIEEVVAEVFLKIFPNFVTLKTSDFKLAS